MQRGQALLLLLALILGACTMRSALDAMTSPEDRAFATSMIDHLRTGDEDWLRARFSPDLWEQSAKRVGQAPEMFPSTPEATELVAFSTISSNRNGATERTKSFILVTHGGGRWTVTSFRTRSVGWTRAGRRVECGSAQRGATRAGDHSRVRCRRSLDSGRLDRHSPDGRRISSSGCCAASGARAARTR